MNNLIKRLMSALMVAGFLSAGTAALAVGREISDEEIDDAALKLIHFSETGFGWTLRTFSLDFPDNERYFPNAAQRHHILMELGFALDELADPNLTAERRDYLENRNLPYLRNAYRDADNDEGDFQGQRFFSLRDPNGFRHLLHAYPGLQAHRAGFDYDLRPQYQRPAFVVTAALLALFVAGHYCNVI